MRQSVWAGAKARRSERDASVNWVAPADVGMLEARYVRRDRRKVIVYLSSQTGCRQGCRMCHLTASRQVRLRDASVAEILAQADTVLDAYRQTEPAQVAHFNFMARGEPLASEVVMASADAIQEGLKQRARALDLRPRVLVSTILPRALGERPLEDVFVRHHPELYYSIYSMDPSFRRRWLPSALPADAALDRLVSWQRHTNKIVKLHYAFIEGHNDRPADVDAICDAVDARRLRVDVNIVRYNPWDDAGAEPAEVVIQRRADQFQARWPSSRVQVVPRVGIDVQASCGMFAR